MATMENKATELSNSQLDAMLNEKNPERKVGLAHNFIDLGKGKAVLRFRVKPEGAPKGTIPQRITSVLDYSDCTYNDLMQFACSNGIAVALQTEWRDGNLGDYVHVNVKTLMEASERGATFRDPVAECEKEIEEAEADGAPYSEKQVARLRAKALEEKAKLQIERERRAKAKADKDASANVAKPQIVGTVQSTAEDVKANIVSMGKPKKK
jgi:hypothetical protein